MAKPASKKVIKKTPGALLGKPGKRSYTKGQLVGHMAAVVSGKGLGDISKKQAAAFIEELGNVMFSFASLGAPLPGLGKLVLREIPAKPARTIVSFGKEIQVSAKPKSRKLVFRFSKDAKARIK
jgi:nucleoid DNA-binding protein